jgi:hypothetical protein
MQPVLPLKTAIKLKHQYSVLLANGASFTVSAESWEAVYCEDGSITAYHFYADKRKVLSLDACDVRSIGDVAMVEIEKLHKALTKPSRRKKLHGQGN